MDRFYYLKHQITAWNDPRIQTMVKQEGAKAYGTYWYIIEKLNILPEPRAELKYLRHFVEKGFSFNYMMKIVTEFGLFKVENGYFSNLDLNIRAKKVPSVATQDDYANGEASFIAQKNRVKQIESSEIKENAEEKYMENEPNLMNNQNFIAQKQHFFDEKNDFQKNENGTNQLKINELEKEHISYKENIENKITTTTEEKEETAAAVDKAIDSSPSIFDDNPVTPVHSWQRLVDDMRLDSMWVDIACMKSGYGKLLKRYYKEAVEEFRRHIILYGKGGNLLTMSDVQQYFANYTAAGNRTSIALHDYLLTLDAGHQNKHSAYCHERFIDGHRTYGGEPIPHDAPPRPNDCAVWNKTTRKWVTQDNVLPFK
ncbi:DUF4373 domain-containing protein [Bacteroidaceae bacterium HV4-6-C5C]|nr:DUF4373 domain-containing protein [Bacteroidaceae bacterium HV4-6-C5C]